MFYYVLFMLPALILSIYAQFKVKSTFKRYSKVASAQGITGVDVASTLLRRNGLGGVVKVGAVRGKLTDHYDPTHKVVNLSEAVYNQNSLAALGIAAHECGHAIQHSQAYGPLELRHRLVPVTNIASSASFPIILIGLLLSGNPLGANLILLGVALFSLVVIFQLVTLPVEFDASKRAVALLSDSGIITPQESPAVKKVLNAAALTYVAAAFSAILTLLYYLLMFVGIDN